MNKTSEAQLQSNRRWRLANPEKVRVGKQRYYLANKGTLNAIGRAGHMRRRYGLTTDEVDALKARGCGLCARTDGILHIDHDHNAGVVRGVLCMRCNVLVGYLEKTAPELLVAAMRWVRDT